MDWVNCCFLCQRTRADFQFSVVNFADQRGPGGWIVSVYKGEIETGQFLLIRRGRMNWLTGMML